ncbi:hypothetical protein Zmor_019940 [Zophobas morio]|uniref:Gustatory receptor n=1 Tax=Zophobas morio TaxID=2755281 RepID=A0AA38I2I8_9CUCU|nr:hypothetical protein Zmor_019940 [Zophobas morio]
MNFSLSVRDINFIKPFFLYLNIFLITPWYDFNKNSFYWLKFSILHACFLIVIKFIWIFSLNLGFADENDFVSWNFLFIFWTFSLVVRTLATVLKSTLWHVDNWKTLITNFKYIDIKLKNGGHKETFWKNFYFVFFLQNIVFFMIIVYQLNAFSSMTKIEMWKGLWLSPLGDFYQEFLLVILISELVKSVKIRYKDLNETLIKNCGRLDFKEIKLAGNIFRILGETVDLISQIFGYQIISILFHFGLQIIVCLNYIFIMIHSSYKDFTCKMIIGQVFLMIFVAFNVVMIIFPIDSATQEARKFIDLCHKLQEKFQKGEDEIFTKVINSCKHFHREFTAAGYFDINRALIFCILANVATYYIITIQLNESQCQKTNKNYTT